MRLPSISIRVLLAPTSSAPPKNMNFIYFTAEAACFLMV
jgi:hypothetical protein